MPSVNIKKNGQWVGQPVLGFKIGEDNLTDELKEKIAKGADADLSDYATKEEVEALTAEDVDAAPAGYGLGMERPTKINSIAELDDLRYGNGLFFLNNFGTGITINNVVFNYAFVRIMTDNEGYNTIQEVCPIAQTTRLIRASTSTTAWGDWECVNPPLVQGVEYRTTEKYNGSPVYVKTVSFGTLPNNTEKSVKLLDTGLQIRSIDGFASGNGYIMPVLGHAKIASISYNTGNGNIFITTTADMSAYSCYLTFKYTKA